jgi:hypothetical protein
MSSREMMIDREARDLWRALRSDAPPEHLTGSELLQVLISQSTQLGYDRLCSPFLRPSQISRPPSHP